MSNSEDVSKAIARYSAVKALAAFSKSRECADCLSTQESEGTPGDPGHFHGLAIPYDTWTGDGRFIAKGSVAWGEEPIPLIFDPEDSDHDGFTIGYITEIFADDAGVHVAGTFVKFTESADQARLQQAKDLIAANAIGWSAALDAVEGVLRLNPRDDVQEHKDGSLSVKISYKDMTKTYTSSRMRHLALVDTPAFPGARPILGSRPVTAAGVAPFPAANFAVWESAERIPLQVTPDGRVFGHAAGDGCYRDGTSACKRYQADPDQYMRNFHTGTASLDNGEVIRVGALTCAGLHAPAQGPVADQRRHHEDSTTVWAKVRAWNDSRGRLCVAGSVVGDFSAAKLQQVAGLPLSPELWPVPGLSGLTLVGLHSVVLPAWPV